MSNLIQALTIAPHGATHIGFYGDDIIFIKEHEEARSDAWGVNSKQWQEIEDFDVSLIYGIRAIKDVKIEAELLKQIEQIKAERDELASQLVAVKEGGGTGQSPCAKFCESVALRKDFDQLREHADKMKVERDALAAQVAAYKERSSELYKLCDELIDHLRYNKAERDEVLNEFWNKQEAIKHVPSEPQQCLAEIRAEAGRAGFVACWDWMDSDGILDTPFNTAAYEYASKVLQGGK